MQELKKQKLENEKDTELLVSRWLQQAGREATHARVTDRRPKVGQDYDDAMYSPLKGIGDTLDTMVMCGASPTTVQVDKRVTRSLTMCRYDLPQNAPFRWVLIKRAIIPLPRGIAIPQQ